MKTKTQPKQRGFLTTRELAQRVGRSPRTVEKWRPRGIGPAYIVISGQARYLIEDVQEWERSKQQRDEQVLTERRTAHRKHNARATV